MGAGGVVGRTNVGSSGCGKFSFFFREISQLGVCGGWVGVWLGDGGVRGQASLFGADCTDLPFVAEAGSGSESRLRSLGSDLPHSLAEGCAGSGGTDRVVIWRDGDCMSWVVWCDSSGGTGEKGGGGWVSGFLGGLAYLVGLRR